MKFEEVLPYFREGKKIYRRHNTDIIWEKYDYINISYLLADDWQFVKEKVKKKLVIYRQNNMYHITHEKYKDVTSFKYYYGFSCIFDSFIDSSEEEFDDEN